MNDPDKPQSSIRWLLFGRKVPLSKPELFLWLIFLGMAMVTLVWGYG